MANVFIKADGNGRVVYQHNFPFHEKWGLGKSEDELLQEGLLVDSVPEPVDQEGKTATLYVDTATKELYYKYEDVSKSEIQLLNERLDEQNQAIAELTLLLSMGGM